MNSLSPLRIHNDTLIPLVEKRPVLWDTTLEVPKRKKAKRKAWKEVCRELYADFDEMEDEERDEYVNGVKQRCQCLHETFLKKKDEDILNKSGSGLKKYIYADKMDFLDKIYSSAQSPNSFISSSHGLLVEKSTPKLALVKIAKELVSQEKKLDNFETRNNFEFNSSELHGCKFLESPKGASNDKPPKCIFGKNMQETDQLPEIRFLDKLPEHRSPLKEAQDKEVSEKTDCLKPVKQLQSNGIDPESLSDKQSKDMYASESHSQILTNDFHKDMLTDARLKNSFESSDGESFKSPESESSDDLPEDKISEKLHNESSDILPKDRNVDKLSEDKSTPKPVSSKVTRKLVFQKGMTEKGKTSKKSKDIKSNCQSTEPSTYIFAAKSTEDLFTDEQSTDRFSKKRRKNASINGHSVAKKLCKKKSIQGLSENRFVDELSKDESTSRSVSSNTLVDKPLGDRWCKNRSSAQSSTYKSVENLPKDSCVDQPSKYDITDKLSKHKSTKMSSKNKCSRKSSKDKNRSPAQLSKGKSLENSPKGSCVDQPSKHDKNDKLSKHRSTKKSSKDKCSRKSSKDKCSKKSSKDKFSRKSSKDRFTDKSIANNLTNKPSKTEFASNPSNDKFTEKTPVPEREDIVHQTDTTKQSAGGQHMVVNYLGSQSSSSEHLQNFNMVINSVMPHLNSFDESETLDFQIGVLRVLQVIQHTRNSSQEHPPVQFPQQFLNPETPATSESGLL